MNVQQEVLAVLDQVLSLKGRTAHMNRDTALLGSIPELDSMAVVAVLTAIEERFGVTIGDDELDAATFETVGSLTDFVANKVGA